MIKKRKLLVLSVIFIILFLVSINYFMSVLLRTESEVRNANEWTYEAKILQELDKLDEGYRVKSPPSDNRSDEFAKSVLSRDKTEFAVPAVWKQVNAAVSRNGLFNSSRFKLGSVLKVLKTARIIKADLDTRGTQLKLLLTLDGNQTVVFKPKWYEKERIIEGPVYAGKDRYSSEILAFYLSGLLDKPIAPISTERVVNLHKEILPVASKPLLQTTFRRRNSTCIYGACHYCKKEDPVCDVDGSLTGAVIFNVGSTLKTHRSPWQRTYKQGKKAVWEVNTDYCKSLVGKFTKQRLYDLIDTAIFDFLIQNGDRHHYETLNDSIVWIDNGKGLGNPNIHHLDILAPLYQCCVLRHSTWNKLKSLSGGALKEKLLEFEEIARVVSQKHIESIEKRLSIVYATVEFCRKRDKIKHNLFYVHLYEILSQSTFNLYNNGFQTVF